jgi:hypothetical protein
MLVSTSLKKKGLPMNKLAMFLCAVLLAAPVLGCARAAKDTTGFAIEDAQTIRAPFPAVWQASKDVLRDKDLQIYTRDKRGEFVAFSEMRRELLIFTPKRSKLTLTLEPLSSEATEARIVTINQVYGVTLLTYPNWHDRQTEDTALAQAILAEIDARATGKTYEVQPSAAESGAEPEEGEPADDEAEASVESGDESGKRSKRGFLDFIGWPWFGGGDSEEEEAEESLSPEPPLQPAG